MLEKKDALLTKGAFFPAVELGEVKGRMRLCLHSLAKQV